MTGAAADREVEDLNRDYDPKPFDDGTYRVGDTYFARVPDGNVRISTLFRGKPPVEHTFIPTATWNEIVAFLNGKMDRMAERRAALVVLGLNPSMTHTIADRVAAWKHQWLVASDDTRAILRELAPSLGINVESME